jgi:hypothetical protein
VAEGISPAPHALEGFVADCSLPSAKQPHGHTTVKAYLAAIRSWHIKSGLPSPTEGLLRVELLIRALRKRQGVSRRKITVDQLVQVLDPTTTLAACCGRSSAPECTASCVVVRHWTWSC